MKVASRNTLVVIVVETTYGLTMTTETRVLSTTNRNRKNAIEAILLPSHEKTEMKKSEENHSLSEK